MLRRDSGIATHEKSNDWDKVVKKRKRWALEELFSEENENANWCWNAWAWLSQSAVGPLLSNVYVPEFVTSERVFSVGGQRKILDQHAEESIFLYINYEIVPFKMFKKTEYKCFNNL